MKILVSNHNFYPDHSGIALYSTDLPIFFAGKGHEVKMVTGFSYYPKWRKRQEEMGALFRNEQYKGVIVLRGYIYVPKKVTSFRRIIHDLSFLPFAFVNFIRAGRHDLIIILTPPLLLGLVGVFFQKIWGSRLIIHIQDLQLDAALSLGMIKKNILMKLLDKIDLYINRKCDLIITITDGMKEYIKLKGIDNNKLLVVYNWIDVKDASQKGVKGAFISNFSELSDKFLVSYAGNIGVKQGIDTLVNLAEATKDNDRIHYFVIGDGAEKDKLLKIASGKRLKNLTFLPLLDQESYFNMLQDIE